MITGTFSLCQQLINTNCFPPIKMVYTSEKLQGQIYIPAANFWLMVGTIAIVGAFKNLTNLTDAYGFCVATVMFSTTILIAIQIFYVKHLPAVLALAFLIFFGFFDGLVLLSKPIFPTDSFSLQLYSGVHPLRKYLWELGFPS